MRSKLAASSTWDGIAGEMLCCLDARRTEGLAGEESNITAHLLWFSIRALDKKGSEIVLGLDTWI